ncbi:MAG: hypothetical protein ACRYGG_03160 [Janthinobacterium lividum]
MLIVVGYTEYGDGANVIGIADSEAEVKRMIREHARRHIGVLECQAKEFQKNSKVFRMFYTVTEAAPGEDVSNKVGMSYSHQGKRLNG